MKQLVSTSWTVSFYLETMPVKFTEITFLAHGSESSAVLGSLPKGVFERLSLTESEACTECLYNNYYRDDLPETLGKTTAQECKVYFRSTCVTQKRLFLSALI